MMESNEIEMTGPDSRDEQRENSRNQGHSIERPFGDAANLNEIPRIRSDDPPMRHWWTDDEPQQNGGSQPNG